MAKDGFSPAKINQVQNHPILQRSKVFFCLKLNISENALRTWLYFSRKTQKCLWMAKDYFPYLWPLPPLEATGKATWIGFEII